jgi:hypothetical protein
MRPSPLFRQLARRLLSNVPESTVYGGPRPQEPARRVTLTTLRGKHRRGEPITVVTAYDYPSAVHVDSAGVDVCLVGDSAAMVVHGHDTTLPMSLDLMLDHCRAVARGASRSLLVGDLPFGCYESSSTRVQYTTLFLHLLLSDSIYATLEIRNHKPITISQAWPSSFHQGTLRNVLPLFLLVGRDCPCLFTPGLPILSC